MSDSQQHWENVFCQKSGDQKSWYQQYPSTSIRLIEELGLPKNATIIDIGGGDSFLVDVLLEKGYSNITVLDISPTAIKNVRQRLGDKGSKVNWVVGDIVDYKPNQQFDLWHDRAVFHFLTEEEEIDKYVEICRRSIASYRYLVLGTFSDKGPTKCSGLPITQYSEDTMSLRFQPGFDKIKCIEEDHITPAKLVQSFIFCTFKKSLLT